MGIKLLFITDGNLIAVKDNGNIAYVIYKWTIDNIVVQVVLFMQWVVYFNSHIKVFFFLSSEVSQHTHRLCEEKPLTIIIYSGGEHIYYVPT